MKNRCSQSANGMERNIPRKTKCNGQFVLYIIYLKGNNLKKTMERILEPPLFCFLTISSVWTNVSYLMPCWGE